MPLVSSGQNNGMLKIAEIMPKRRSLGHRILPNAGELVSLASSSQNDGMLVVVVDGTLEDRGGVSEMLHLWVPHTLEGNVCQWHSTMAPLPMKS